MTRNTYGNVGYEPGRQCPFTPSKGASWIESFNTKLVEMNRRSGISRNKLTELLLEQALQEEIHSDSVAIDCSDLNFAEKELLKSEHVQGLIKNMLRNMVAVSNEIVQTQIKTIHQTEGKIQHEKDIEPVSMQLEADVVTETQKDTENKPPEINTDEVRSVTNTNSAALNRMRSLRNSVK